MELSAQIICIICQETLSRERGPDAVPIVATECGHVFHKECLAQWFSKSQPVPFMLAALFANEEDRLSGNCPVCATPQWMTRCQRIYLSVDDAETTNFKARMEVLGKELEQAKERIATAEQEKIKKVGEIKSKLAAANKKIRMMRMTNCKCTQMIPGTDRQVLGKEIADIGITCKSKGKDDGSVIAKVKTQPTKSTIPKLASVNENSGLSKMSQPRTVDKVPTPRTITMILRSATKIPQPSLPAPTPSLVKRTASVRQATTVKPVGGSGMAVKRGRVNPSGV